MFLYKEYVLKLNHLLNLNISLLLPMLFKFAGQHIEKSTHIVCIRNDWYINIHILCGTVAADDCGKKSIFVALSCKGFMSAFIFNIIIYQHRVLVISGPLF